MGGMLKEIKERFCVFFYDIDFSYKNKIQIIRNLHTGKQNHGFCMLKAVVLFSERGTFSLQELLFQEVI